VSAGSVLGRQSPTQTEGAGLHTETARLAMLAEAPALQDSKHGGREIVVAIKALNIVVREAAMTTRVNQPP